MTQAPVPQGGKVALVTGGSTGLGEHIALELQREGWVVAVCGRRQDKLDAIAGRGIGAFQCDIGVRDDVLRMKEWLVRTYGRLDVLVNCAAITLKRTKFLETDLADLDRLMQINVIGTMQVTHAMLPLLIERKGSVVNFSSTLAQRPRPGASVYSASKGAVEAFTRALALEAAEHGVRVNCIAPALVRSDIYVAAGMAPEDYERMLQVRALDFPLKRVGEPEDVTGMVSYLVSERAKWITGLCLHVDGGGMLG